eukprot:6198356-Pleurochrysis_carterae.AAC.1
MNQYAYESSLSFHIPLSRHAVAWIIVDRFHHLPHTRFMLPAMLSLRMLLSYAHQHERGCNHVLQHAYTAHAYAGGAYTSTHHCLYELSRYRTSTCAQIGMRPTAHISCNCRCIRIYFLHAVHAQPRYTLHAEAHAARARCILHAQAHAFAHAVRE